MGENLRVVAVSVDAYELAASVLRAVAAGRCTPADGERLVGELVGAAR